MLLLIVASLNVIHATLVSSTPCERAPPNAQPGDAFYTIGIAGDPDLFLPGELYTVSLHGVDNGQGPTPFIGFLIWTELEKDSENVSINNSNVHNQALGAFQAYDAQAKAYELCKPAVVNATEHPKTDIQVIWTAPSGYMDVCVRLCARATQSNGAMSSVLARKLCPALATTASVSQQPPIIEPCCACDEAKYEVTFEGLWSRNTHPREFPPESARAHFGDVIGASHTAQYRVWQEGRVASAGLRRLADDGLTTALEKELKAESDHIRTIIKARGISWQQVAGVGIPSTFAVFRVDAKHHLMSLAAKLAPSPDWIVGVSALELCNANCTWRRSATLPLFPYDAGTDNGISYTSRRQPTSPPAAVRALRPQWPRDVRSPFYSETGEMRPFARLRLTRLRLYEKSCDAIETGGQKASETAETSGSCTVNTWSAWGPCSVTCGSGRMARQRQYIWPARARIDACRIPLTEYRRCRGRRMHCRVQSEYEPEPGESSGPCALSQWSAWSPCEGCGVRARTRHYLAPRAHKPCSRGYRARTALSQAMPCDAGPCYRPPGFANASNFDWFYVDVPRGPCGTSAWGGWSPCSARCGRGRRLRARLLLARQPGLQPHLTARLLNTWNKRFADLQHLALPVENVTNVDPEVEAAVQEHIDRCQFTMTLQESLCDGEDSSCVNETMFQEICNLPINVGPCRSYEERWFYDAEHEVCEPFGYTGCGGNANNFKTRDVCEQACATNNNTLSTAPPQIIETTSKRVKPLLTSADNEVLQNDFPVHAPSQIVETTVQRENSLFTGVDEDIMQNDSPVPDVNCEMGPWLGWSECFGDCDASLKLNYRLVLQPASGSGKPCQKVVKSRPCKLAHCKKQSSTNNTDTFYSYLSERDD